LGLAPSQQSLPIALAPGERVIAQDQFMFSLAHFFLSTTVLLSDRRMSWRRPNTLAGLIPLGGQTTTFPLANIASVTTASWIRVLRLLFGLILAVGGFFNIATWWGWIVVLVGAFLVVTAFRALLVVVNSGGQRYAIQLALTNRSAAERFAASANQAIASRGVAAAPSGPQVSPDGRFWWDGRQWQPMPGT